MSSLSAFFRRISAWSFCLALALTGCGGGGGNGGSNNTSSSSDGQTLEQVLAQPLGVETSCPSLSLSSTSAVPGDRITVTGLPAEMDTISLRVIAEKDAGEPLVDPLFVSIDEETDEVSFVAPVHPTGDPEGGEVQLEPGDGDLHCPKQSFTVQPLPQAPSDYPVTIANKLETWVDKVLVTMGYDPQTILNADPDTLPDARLHLWLAKQFVSGDGDDKLPALSRQARDHDGDLVARFLMASGLEQEIDRALQELASTTTGQLEPREQNQTKTLTRSGDSGIADTTGGAMVSSVSFSPTADCEEQSIDPDALEITSTEQLSNQIQSADDGALSSTDEASKSGQLLGLGGLALEDTAGDVAGHLGTAHFVATTVDSARHALKPQEISEFTVENVQTEWVEDRPQTDTLFWDGATVRARGSSINISEITLKSLVAGAGMASGPIGNAVGALSAAAPDAVNGVIADVTEDSCVRIRPPEYGPFNVDSSQWTEVDTGSTIKLTSSSWSQDYYGVNIGPSALTISLKQSPFALDAPVEESFIVNVVQVNTSLIPSSVNLTNPGEQVKLEATATNPHKPDNRDNFVATALGAGTIVSQSGNGTRYQVTFDSPDQPEDYPTEVEFKAQHKTLPSGTGRTYTVDIDVGGELAINERNVCIQPGHSRSFSAAVDGFGTGNESVTWSASGGSISSSGDQTANYQAPGTTGSETVTATADADGSVTDTVSITVSDNCMRKLWVPAAVIGMDGNGTYPDGSVLDCPGTGGEHDEAQEKKLEAVNPPTSLSDLLNRDDYWYDRTRDLSGSFSHSSTRYLHDDQDDQCKSVSLSGQNKATLEYVADADGTLSASLDSQLQIQCSAYSDSDNTIECSNGGGTIGLGMGSYILDLTEERSLILEGELSCTALEGNVGVGFPMTDVGLTADVSRYVNGEPWEPDPEFGSTGVENPDGSLRTPRLFDITCDQSDDVVSINEEFVLTAPPDGETHQVIISLSGGLQTQPSTDGKDHFGPPTSPTELDRVTGTHNSNADIDFSVKLSRN